jgi:hypothetical protein
MMDLARGAYKLTAANALHRGRLFSNYISVPDAVPDDGSMSSLGEDGVTLKENWPSALDEQDRKAAASGAPTALVNKVDTRLCGRLQPWINVLPRN